MTPRINKNRKPTVVTRRIGTLVQRFRAVVTFARTGGYGDAASELNLCLQETLPLLSDGTIPGLLMPKMAYSLETMFLMQKHDDWVAIADVIEYEFMDLLSQITASNTISPT